MEELLTKEEKGYLNEIIASCNEEVNKETVKDIKKTLDFEESEFDEKDFWRSWNELKKRFKRNYKSSKSQK